MHRAYRSLAVLTAITILAVGSLAQALVAPSGVIADIATAASLLVLLVSSILTVRVLRYLTH